MPQITKEKSEDHNMGGRYTPLHRLLGVSDPGWGNPPEKILNPTESYCPSCPPSKKALPLHS